MKTYELKNATFTCDEPDAETIRELSDEQLVAMARNAYSAWAFRRGARAESHGKHYTVEQVVNDMLATGERSSGPSKKDVEAAETLFYEVAKLQRNASEADKEAVLARAIAKFTGQNPDFKFTLDDESAAMDNAAAFLSARRRYLMRKTKGIDLL